MDGIPPLKDPQLSIKDLTFDGIPVRMYQPRGSCDGGWRGILYFHGGIGLYGSIGKKLKIECLSPVVMQAWAGVP